MFTVQALVGIDRRYVVHPFLCIMIFFFYIIIVTHCIIARIVYKTEEMYIFMWLASRLVFGKRKKKSHG